MNRRGKRFTLGVMAVGFAVRAPQSPVRGADVRVSYLEPGDGGAKVGLDDFFAAGGTVEKLLKCYNVASPPELGRVIDLATAT